MSSSWTRTSSSRFASSGSPSPTSSVRRPRNASPRRSGSSAVSMTRTSARSTPGSPTSGRRRRSSAGSCPSAPSGRSSTTRSPATPRPSACGRRATTTRSCAGTVACARSRRPPEAGTSRARRGSTGRPTSSRTIADAGVRICPAGPAPMPAGPYAAAGTRAAGAGMAVLAAHVRHLIAHGFGLGDVAARVAGALTAAIDREQAEAASARDAGTSALPMEARVRIATFFALACGVLFLPVDGTRVPSDVLASLLILYAAHAALTSVVLIASFTARGERYADALAVGLVVGHAVNLLVYVFVWPRHPGLPAGILACLLMGNTVLFGWPMGRVLVLAIIFCAGFLAVGTVSVPRGVERPELFVAAIVLAVGAMTSVGCARLLSLLRASLAERQRELTDLS